MTHSISLPHASSIAHSLSASKIRDVANSAMGMTNVLPFWFGETDQATPEFIRQAAAASLMEGETFYSQNLGRPYLREAIAGYLSRLHGRTIDSSRIAAVISGLSGLKLASELLFEPGDKVVAITPLWPNLTEIPKLRLARVERVSLEVKDGSWHLDVDKLLSALTPDTRALLINSPNNPTGWTIDRQSLETILQHCRQHGIWIIADDVYERLVYDPKAKKAPSVLEYLEPDDRIISVNSFSKAWCMTGWRAGWMVLPESLMDDLAKLIEFNFSCLFEPVQKACSVALEEGEPHIQSLRASLSHSRQLLVNHLSQLPGVELPAASGAMYVFFRLQGIDNSMQLAKELVKDVGLGLAPGIAFGPEGEGWLRWCHAVSDDNALLEGVDRLSTFISHRS